MLDFLIDWRLEIYAAVGLTILCYVRFKYAGNLLIARFVQGAVDELAERIEKSGKSDVHPDSPLSQKAALRRKVRRQLARQARKAARKKK